MSLYWLPYLCLHLTRLMQVNRLSNIISDLVSMELPLTGSYGQVGAINYKSSAFSKSME